MRVTVLPQASTEVKFLRINLAAGQVALGVTKSGQHSTTTKKRRIEKEKSRDEG
jgi:hypothetical protein